MIKYNSGIKIKDQDVKKADKLYSRRSGTRYGTRVLVGDKPAVHVQSRGKQDYITPEEIIEDLYGKKVEEIVFKD